MESHFETHSPPTERLPSRITTQGLCQSKVKKQGRPAETKGIECGQLQKRKTDNFLSNHIYPELKWFQERGDQTWDLLDRASKTRDMHEN